MPIPRFRIRTLMIAVAVVGAAIAVVLVARRPKVNWGVVTLENRSGKSLARLTIATDIHAVDFVNVPNGQTASAPFPMRDVDPMTLEGRYADGEALGASMIKTNIYRTCPTFILEPQGAIKASPGGTYSPAN